MWKDFFYYSKGERRAVYVLCILIAVLIVGLVVSPDVRRTEGNRKSDVDTLALENFPKEVERPDKRKQLGGVSDMPVILKEFDPNLVDSVGLLRLGLSPFVARNVLKYREKGGSFPTPESFSRIYGLKKEQFEALKPYIRISDSFVRKKPRRTKTWVVKEEAEKRDSTRIFKYPVGTRVDVNKADTAELKKIPGIGSGIARMIVTYRERLGGFYDLEQLKEVKYVRPELLEWFKLEEVALRKLNVNVAELEKLRAHPYINFYQAKVIVEHRRKRGKISSLSQLSLYEEFTEKDLIRLANYVCFD